jgi:ATP-binding cassette, subfamily B, bacterial
MDAGRLVETGTHAELLARGGAYAKLARTELAIAVDQPEAAE